VLLIIRTPTAPVLEHPRGQLPLCIVGDVLLEQLAQEIAAAGSDHVQV
jgi:hypothetical protein